MLGVTWEDGRSGWEWFLGEVFGAAALMQLAGGVWVLRGCLELGVIFRHHWESAACIGDAVLASLVAVTVMRT